MILITQTYTETTPESAELGDLSDSGILSEDESLTFGDLVQLMGDHHYPSSVPCSGNICDWLSDAGDIVDYATCTERVCSLHYSHKNPARNAKYWRLAMIAAGIIKRGKK